MREKVPAPFLRPCKKKMRNKVENPTTETLTQRLRYTESALQECGLQVGAIVRWNDGLDHPPK